VQQISERRLNQFMDDFFHMIVMCFGMPFGQTKYNSVHDLKDRFLVDSPKKDLFNEVVIHNDFQNLQTTINIHERETFL
jgi:hypothetical protein